MVPSEALIIPYLMHATMFAWHISAAHRAV